MNYDLKNWSNLLPSAEFAYNNQAHEGTKESSFFLEYGRNPRTGPILVKKLLNKNLNDLTYKRQEALEQAKAALSLAAVSYASSTYPENYIPAVMPPLNHTSPPSMAATFLATRLMAVLQPSGYSVFHGGDTPIQLSLP